MSERAIAVQSLPQGVPRLLPAREVVARVAICRARIYALMSEESFPRPVKVGRRSLWYSSEVDAWIADTLKQRDALAAAAA
jgi:predicted DNA-binding transcriptional regulator AlpA